MYKSRYLKKIRSGPTAKKTVKIKYDHDSAPPLDVLHQRALDVLHQRALNELYSIGSLGRPNRDALYDSWQIQDQQQNTGNILGALGCFPWR